MRHVLRAQDFDLESITQLFCCTDAITGMFNNPESRLKLLESFRGRSAVMLFYEPSTRTRISFNLATSHLGMVVVSTENAAQFSSAVKGETLEDSIRVICEYGVDIIVLRHPETGAADRAVEVIERFGYQTHIVNAGDGQGQHPTQALLDLYTIRKHSGRLHDLKVVIGGDLQRGRTARSLVYLLSKYDNNGFVFVSPPELRMGSDILQHLKEHEVWFQEANSLVAISDADVIYWTRTQKERGSADSSQMVINTAVLKGLTPTAIIMHPLPRVGEITKEVDLDPRAMYFKQAGYGMFVRMALIQLLLSDGFGGIPWTT